MPVKIRLARHGRKRMPFYHIVVTDSRAPRDGNYIERIGMYNPRTNPATIELEFDKAMKWLQNGAQPTDTCRAILSKQGVMMKKHLLEGVKKGAFSLEEAEVRFNKWVADKESKTNVAKDSLTKQKESEAKKRLEAESKVREARAAEIAKKAAAAAAVPVAEEAPAEEVAPVAEEAPAEEVAPSEEAAAESTSEEAQA